MYNEVKDIKEMAVIKDKNVIIGAASAGVRRRF